MTPSELIVDLAAYCERAYRPGYRPEIELEAKGAKIWAHIKVKNRHLGWRYATSAATALISEWLDRHGWTRADFAELGPDEMVVVFKEIGQ